MKWQFSEDLDTAAFTGPTGKNQTDSAPNETILAFKNSIVWSILILIFIFCNATENVLS